MFKAAFCTVFLGSAAFAQTITDARFIEPTPRYGHHPMGPTVTDHGALELSLSDHSQRVIRLPPARVFEDNIARVVDVTGDGTPEVVVVESDTRQGARVSVYGSAGLVAASPFIGRRNRWFAIAGIGDLDGDGQVEIAAVDRPHLRRTLVIWRLSGNQLTPVSELSGVTNHRFGEAAIQGGLRECADGPELIVARADWSELVAVRFARNSLSRRDLGVSADAHGFALAMACRD